MTALLYHNSSKNEKLTLYQITTPGTTIMSKITAAAIAAPSTVIPGPIEDLAKNKIE